MAGGWTGYAVPLAVAAIVLAFRWRRIGRARPLTLERLWILPALYAIVCVAAFAAVPPHGWAWLSCAVALAIGAALGWQRGGFVRIAVDPDTHRLNQRGSPAALLLIVVLVLVRMGGRAASDRGWLAIDPMAVTDVLMALALGLFAAQRAEMYLRGRRLLREARASGQPAGIA